MRRLLVSGFTKTMPVVALVGLVLIILAIRFGSAKPPAPGGISFLEQIKLGGVQQWVSIRGADPHAPVLLFLHGGPGSASLAKLRQQTPELEQYFVVVNWDQLGAGKSTSLAFDYETLSIEQMVSDAHELVAYLKARFGVEKLYLMGFSWGTVIGLELTARYPQDFYAYISVSQLVFPAEGERLSLEFVRQAAQQAGNDQALAELAVIDPAYQGAGWQSQLGIERNWLVRYGGVYHTADSYNHEIWSLLRAQEYSVFDVCLWPLGSSRSLGQLWPEVMALDFFQNRSAIEIPVYFFVGRFDYNSPAELAEQYFQHLNAPMGKGLVWFENSAHDLFFDEPQKLVQETLAILESTR